MSDVENAPSRSRFWRLMTPPEPDSERREQDGLRLLALDDRGLASGDFGQQLDLSKHRRLASLEDPLPESAERDRLVRIPHASLDRVGKVDDVRLAIDDPDVYDLGVEDRLDPVADEVVHRLHVELLGEAPLDVVDEGQLGRSLVGLRQQPARLVEQAGVLEGDAQARRERRQQSNVRVRERLLKVEILKRDPAADLFADDQRRDQD